MKRKKLKLRKKKTKIKPEIADPAPKKKNRTKRVHSEGWYKYQEILKWEWEQLELAKAQYRRRKKKGIILSAHPFVSPYGRVSLKWDRFLDPEAKLLKQPDRLVFQPSLPPSDRVAPVLLSDGKLSMEDCILNPVHPPDWNPEKGRWEKSKWRRKLHRKLLSRFGVKESWWREPMSNLVRGDWMLTNVVTGCHYFSTKKDLFKFAKKKGTYRVTYSGESKNYIYKRFDLVVNKKGKNLIFKHGEKKI